MRSKNAEEYKCHRKYLISLKMKVDINECVGEVDVEKGRESWSIAAIILYRVENTYLAVVVSIFREL